MTKVRKDINESRQTEKNLVVNGIKKTGNNEDGIESNYIEKIRIKYSMSQKVRIKIFIETKIGCFV